MLQLRQLAIPQPKQPVPATLGFLEGSAHAAHLLNPELLIKHVEHQVGQLIVDGVDVVVHVPAVVFRVNPVLQL